MINKTTIDTIIETARIEDVVGDFVTLKKRGANLLGLCPFHNEKTPSFTVSPTRGIYKCFGCGVGGNAVNFVMEHEQYSYPDALRYLANKYNIEIEEEKYSPEEAKEQTEKESLFIITGFAQSFFSNNLYNTNEGSAIGLSYLKERGFREDIIEKFQLGYSLDEWEHFTKTAIAKGYQLALLEKTGLTISKEGKQYDRFRSRVIFPIHNLSGKIIGFGGRILKKDTKSPKYVNSPESEIYHKSNVLYGIYFAKKSIITENLCYLVEGYTDVISLHQSNIENVVASSGTSLTVEQIRLIKRYTKNITILYDGDYAGIKASFRGIDMILEEGMNVKIVPFPDEEDPDSYSRKLNSEDFKLFITKNAKDFIVFKTHLLAAEAKNDPIKKTELIREIVTSIALIPDAIIRSVYTKECSTLLQISEQILINELNKQRRNNLQKKLKRENPEKDTYLPSELNISPSQVDALYDILYQEKDIIDKLLHYANQSIQTEMLDDKGNTTETNTHVVSYIIGELQKDNLVLENSLYQKILNEYTEALSRNEILNEQHFIHHEDNNIQKIAIDMVSSKYELHKWAQKGIEVETEDMKLSKTIRTTIYAYKSRKLDLMKLQLQEKIKTQSENDEQEKETLLKQLILIDKAISTFSKELGRVVIK